MSCDAQVVDLCTDEPEASIAGAPDYLVPAHNAMTTLCIRAPGWTALRLGPDGLKPFRQLQKLSLHLPMKELPSELSLLVHLRCSSAPSHFRLTITGSLYVAEQQE